MIRRIRNEVLGITALTSRSKALLGIPLSAALADIAETPERVELEQQRRRSACNVQTT
jgi:hypothetical protein